MLKYLESLRTKPHLITFSSGTNFHLFLAAGTPILRNSRTDAADYEHMQGTTGELYLLIFFRLETTVFSRGMVVVCSNNCI